MTKRESWDVDETRYFLKLVREKQILKSLDGKRFRADDIFLQLEALMQDSGYLKTAKQMQTRFKTLRFTFNKLKRKLNTSGEANCRSKFPYFEEMNVLLSGRPVNTLVGIDSASPGCSSSESPDTRTVTPTSGVEESEPFEDDSQVDGDSQFEGDSQIEVNNDQDVSAEIVEEAEADESEQPPPPKKKKTGRKSYQHTLDQFAETSRNNAQNLQANLIQKQTEMLTKILVQQNEFEKEMMNSFLQAQKEIVQESTTSLLNGLRTILQPSVFPQYVNNSVVPVLHPFPSPNPLPTFTNIPAGSPSTSIQFANPYPTSTNANNQSSTPKNFAD